LRVWANKKKCKGILKNDHGNKMIGKLIVFLSPLEKRGGGGVVRK